MGKGTVYVSKTPNADGLLPYTADENAVWKDLSDRQHAFLPGRACDDYIHALDVLNLPKDRVPQLDEVSRVLKRETGWQVEAVPALISFKKFFTLLAERKFPAATFIRTREEFDYLQEPDIFHEIFGHCPLLTNPVYAAFMQRYGELGLEVAKEDRAMLARLYWFTVEFGLMQPPQEELRIYGAGILSSTGESEYALHSPVPERRPMDLVTCLRTPYRIDIYQPIYYTIENFDELYSLVKDKNALFSAVSTAHKLGKFAPTFRIDDLSEEELKKKLV